MRQNKKIKGTRDTNSQHEISHYKDDVLICLQDPYISLKETLNLSTYFSVISIYTKTAINKWYSHSL